MAKRTRLPSPLLEAAAALDDELARYAQLGQSLLDTPLDSVKHLDRVNGTLTEIAASEERLGACGQALAVAVSAARAQQEQLAQALVERLPAVRARNDRLRELLGELEQLGAEASRLRPVLGATPLEAATSAHGLAERTLALARRAHELSATAREAGFDELGNQAHNLHQQLLAASKKLLAASVRG